MTAKILVVAGSLRQNSHNRRLAQEATRMLALSDAIVTQVNLTDYPMPIYDGDQEEADGLPENAKLLAQRIALCDGLLLVSPEYNHSLPPLLKNAIDWTSRSRRLEGRPIKPYKGLVVALASASPGAGGGQRGLEALRIVLRSLGAEVMTAQCTVPHAGEAFDEKGRLAADDRRIALETLVDRLLDTARTLGRHS